jgi:hypothetical protein
VIQPPGDIIIDERPIGTDARDHPFFMSVIHEVQKIWPHKGLTPANIKLEHLIAGQFVNHPKALIGREFTGFFPT